MMDKQLQEKLKQQLMNEKDELETLINHMEDRGQDVSVQDSISELSMYDNHPADLGSEMFERSKDLALRQDMEQQMDAVKDALDRIEDGTYGTCKSCGKDIPVERLEAIPSTTMCIECKKEDEALPDRHIRPIEEDVISPPFGGFMHDTSERELGDSEDEIMFDGEDTWQTVARFGTSETPQDISVNGITDYDHMYPDADETVGTVERVEQIPYEKNVDGMIYQDFDGEDDETIHSREKVGKQDNSHL